MKFRKQSRGGGLASSQAATGTPQVFTVVHVHLPSSDKWKLHVGHKQKAALRCSQLAGDLGIVIGDMNIHEKD